MICEYLNKSLADYTAKDRESFRRFSQGQSHGKQGRNDLLGKCSHYDAGHKTTTQKTLGKLAYEADVKEKPFYHDGSPRKTWEQLGEVEQWSWGRIPT